MANTVETATPFSEEALKQIANDACEKALSSATEYDHSKAESWNGSIINNILSALTTQNQAESSSSPPRYKYAVTSTIIQHLSPTSTATTSTSTGTDTADMSGTGSKEANGDSDTTATAVKPQPGRRGMHSATGAFWNSQTDGMWSFKWDQGEKKGVDVVVSMLWIMA